MPSLSRFIVGQTAGLVFAGVATTLTAVHPFIHQYEGGTLDSTLEYLYALSLDIMNRNN